MQQIDDFDLIDKYLRNEMTPEEASAFEKTLAYNPELKKEVEIRYDIIVGIRASEQNHILEELNKIDNQKILDNEIIYASKKQTSSKTIKLTKNKINQNLWLWMILLLFIIALIFLFAIN